MDTLFLNKLKDSLLPENILLNENLSRHTTFRIGGLADYFVKIQDVEELKKVIALSKEWDIPYKLIGNGSNIVFSDAGWRGIIIKNEINSNIIVEETDNSNEKTIVTADAGIMMAKFAKELAEHGLSGYEFASGIPGTLGGAIVMNAGAYGGEIGDYIISVKVLSKQGEEIQLKKEELSFSYRHSIIKQADYIVLSASFALNKGDKIEIYRKIDEYNNLRKEKQPLEYPSAGSTFKRPDGNYAGKLIMEAGLAGLQVGKAKVSEKHCGFLINTGGADADDVVQLINKIQILVKEHSGYELEPEIEFVGDFNIPHHPRN